LGLRILFKRSREIGPILRRFFINTLFDSTFVQLGIVISSILAINEDLRLIIGTLVASSFALGISTGVSVYESEMLERERRVVDLEKALFRKLDNTVITENYKTYAMILAFLNFLTPLMCCGIILIPIIFAAFQLLDRTLASWLSVALALAILFTAGTYLGRLSKQNPLIKGLRMVIFGVLAFIIGFLIQMLI
jgi:predicted membrane protein (TIGR00267 family)